MPTYVLTDQCDGCKEREVAACMHICPHDLMALDVDGSATGHAMRAYNVEPEQCWECYACVKACPREAVEVRHYADVVPLGAQVQPTCRDNSIVWTITFRNGNTKRFEFPTRTVLRGSAEPYQNHRELDIGQLTSSEVLFTDGMHACDKTQFIDS